MSTPAAIIENLIASARAQVGSFLPDRCDVFMVTNATGTSGGQTATESAIASSVPCLYEAQREMTATTPGQGPESPVRHKLFLKLDDADVNTVKAKYRLVVAARGDKPALTFTDLRRLDESNEVLLTLTGKLVV